MSSELVSKLSRFHRTCACVCGSEVKEKAFFI
jgi:hypothetical protein